MTTSLNEQISRISKRGILELRYGTEFHEQVVIRRPITIRSISLPATIVGNSPVVTIQSKNVILENLNIVCNDKKSICLSVKKRCEPIMKEIYVKGNIKGLDQEEGEWEIPDVLELAIEPNKVNKNRIIILCPVPARIYPSEISVIHCHPQELVPGLNKIEITIDEMRKDALITGDLIIETSGYHLKRKIALTGSTLNFKPDANISAKEYIWVCPSAEILKRVKNLPEGMQGEPYQFILDQEQLKYDDIQVQGLPEGLAFYSAPMAPVKGMRDRFSISPPKIEGIPKKAGEFELKFGFQKNKLKYKCSAQLKINKKAIIPLKAKPIDDPIKVIENEMVRIRFDILSSNSPNVTFQAKKELPEGLYLNESTGELYGKISKHGTYEAIVKIDDGTNQLNQKIRFRVEPEKPLTLNIEKTYTVYKDEPFEIELLIEDAKRLSPVIKLNHSYSKQISLESVQGKNIIKGKLVKVTDADVKIIIKDIYNRKLHQLMQIHCIEKPAYTLQWLSSSPIRIKGRRFSQFSEQIRAVIRENRKLALTFSCKDLPAHFHLKKDGWLSGKIDGKAYLLNIRAESGEWHEEKAFEVITEEDSSRILTTQKKVSDIFYQNTQDNHAESGEWHEEKAFEVITEEDSSRILTSQKKISDIFYQNTQDNHVDVNIEIKTMLKNGRVKAHYHEALLTEVNNIPNDFYLEVKNLPPGLIYNPNHFAIEGMPEKEGDYIIKVVDSVNQSEIQCYLEISPSPYSQEISDTQESEDNNSTKTDVKEKLLGKAFRMNEK